MSPGVDLKGRVAIVTGASAGLGRRFAFTLARAGAAVVVCARREELLAELVREIESEGLSALAHPLDLTDASAIAAAFDVAEARFGIVDIVINNAAVPDGGYATRLSLETIDRVLGVDFRAPFLMAREAARRLIEAGKPGNIINLSSVGAFHYSPKSAAALYCAVKAGIVRLTEALAIEWAASRINVNAIAPGFFRSEMSGDFIERAGGGLTKRFPRGRIGEPEYLDSTLLYLLDPKSHFVTGACIVVDDAQQSR